MKKCKITPIKLEDGNNIFSKSENIWIVDKQIAQIDPDLVKSLTGDTKRLWLIDGSEKSKSFEMYGKCCEYFLSLGIHRKCHLVALGGGVTSDFAGFVAATLLRGISWSVVPTTLLSMIDAAIGGKTAINSKHGKNLIGAFHMPKEVFIDLTFLKTLPKSEYQSGLGELLKYAFLDEAIFGSIQKGEELHDIVVKCALYKSGVIERDFKEVGERKYLNFGHTLGHALEKEYQISHGEAVYWGIYLILKIIESDLVVRFGELSHKLKIEYNVPPWKKDGLDVKAIMKFVEKDKKKVSSDAIEIVGVREVGGPYIQKITLEIIEEKLGKLKNEIDVYHL